MNLELTPTSPDAGASQGGGWTSRRRILTAFASYDASDGAQSRPEGEDEFNQV